MDETKNRKRVHTQPANSYGIEPLQHTFRTGHLFMIYLTPDMLIDRDEGSYFHDTLNVYLTILKEKLAHNRHDYMGLMLCNVESDDSNVITIQKFEKVTIDMYMSINQAYDKDIDYYKDLICQNNCSIANAFQHSTHAFSTSSPTMTTQQIIFLTSIDNPVPDDPDQAYKIRLAANTFKTLNIKLQIVGFGDNWDYNCFYKEIEELSERSNARRFKKIDLTELEGGIIRQAHVVGNLDLRIGENAKIKVALQNFCAQRKPMKQITITKNTNELLERSNYYIFNDYDYENDDTEDGIIDLDKYPHDILSSYVCGGKSLLLLAHHTNWLRKSRERGIDLIGFKPKPETLPKYQLAPPLFVRCHCSATDPQTQFFATLLKKMNEKNVIAICAVTLKDRMSTRLYALIPYIDYGGFYLHRIPFEEDVRDKVMDIADRFNFKNRRLPVNDDQVNLMKKIIRKLQFVKEHPITVFNPRLQMQREHIEALALELPLDDPPVDGTLPHPEIAEILTRKGLTDQFKDIFPNLVVTQQKARRLDPDIADAIIREKRYLNYTCDKLQSLLRTVGESATGRKNELITRVNAYRQKLCD